LSAAIWLIDSELRLLVAVRKVCRHQGGAVPSMTLLHRLLDERNAVFARRP
jgi:hypothetical protein